MKKMITIFGACVLIVGLALPGTTLASYWSVTFTAESLHNVGNVNTGESILQGDPDLYFVMQIENNSYVFYNGSPVSTTSWDFPDVTVSLAVFSATASPPAVDFGFWLYDEDLDTDDLLGIHSFTVDHDVPTTNEWNNNINFAWVPDPGISYEGSGWPNNYVLTYNVTFTDVTPAVPIPPSVWLFGSGFLGLIGIARRKKAA